LNIEKCNSRGGAVRKAMIIEFKPTHKLMFFGSELPKIDKEKEASFLKRLELIPFAERFTKKLSPIEVKEICAGDEVTTFNPHHADCLKFNMLFMPKS
jgi:phage/plasmid-associated DNA primase